MPLTVRRKTMPLPPQIPLPDGQGRGRELLDAFMRGQPAGSRALASLIGDLLALPEQELLDLAQSYGVPPGPQLDEVIRGVLEHTASSEPITEGPGGALRVPEYRNPSPEMGVKSLRAKYRVKAGDFADDILNPNAHAWQTGDYLRDRQGMQIERDDIRRWVDERYQDRTRDAHPDLVAEPPEPPAPPDDNKRLKDLRKKYKSNSDPELPQWALPFAVSVSSPDAYRRYRQDVLDGAKESDEGHKRVWRELRPDLVAEPPEPPAPPDDNKRLKDLRKKYRVKADIPLPSDAPPPNPVASSDTAAYTSSSRPAQGGQPVKPPTVPPSRNFADEQVRTQQTAYQQEQARQQARQEQPHPDEVTPVEPSKAEEPATSSGPWKAPEVDLRRHLTPEVTSFLENVAVGLEDYDGDPQEFDMAHAAMADWLEEVGYDRPDLMREYPEQAAELARTLALPPPKVPDYPTAQQSAWLRRRTHDDIGHYNMLYGGEVRPFFMYIEKADYPYKTRDGRMVNLPVYRWVNYEQGIGPADSGEWTYSLDAASEDGHRTRRRRSAN